MKAFFYFGRNPANKSGVSWKIWKIGRNGRTVMFGWGPAVIKSRKVRLMGRLHKKKRTFATTRAAIEHERKRIREQLRKGYERMTRNKAA